MAVDDTFEAAPRAREAAQRKVFVSIQIAKAAVGAALVAGFLGFIGRPDVVESIALAGMLAPALLAALAFTPLPLAVLEQVALASFAGLIGYLAALTGGMGSPLIVWLV
ncbi:MAG TPA: hypothetical protein VHE09_01605, partial [Rhizomicrobium sp.]|nr:hypothetical protein [Rhizomicrobium sp.]